PVETEEQLDQIFSIMNIACQFSLNISADFLFQDFVERVTRMHLDSVQQNALYEKLAELAEQFCNSPDEAVKNMGYLFLVGLIELNLVVPNVILIAKRLGNKSDPSTQAVSLKLFRLLVNQFQALEDAEDMVFKISGSAESSDIRRRVINLLDHLVEKGKSYE